MHKTHQRQVNEATEKFADTVRASYEMVANRALSAQEANVELTQELFSGMVNNLRTQAERNREMSQQLAVQQQRRVHATQTLTQESISAYTDFVNSMLSFYLGSSKRAQRGRQARSNGTLPLESYDSLNAKAVIEKMEGLGVEEIKRLRDYEVTNKNRRTLVERFDARIAALEADLPLANYDSLGVIGVIDRLEGLSVEEIKRLRDYEAKSKNRPTLMKHFEARIEGGPSS